MSGNRKPTAAEIEAQRKEDAAYKAAAQRMEIVTAAGIKNGMSEAECRARVLRVLAGLPPVAGD